MKKLGILFLTIFFATTFLLFVGNLQAQGVSRGPAIVIPSGKTVIVPKQAIDNSPVLEKLVIIHYRKGFGKPGTECGNGICETGESAKKCPADCGGGQEEPKLKCYGFLSRGTKLKSVEILTIHPGLDSQVISDSATEWDSHTSGSLFGDFFAIDDTANWDGWSDSVPDGRNEFSFGNYPEPEAIAVTVIWGYFSGPPKTREIVEFDVLFNKDYDWGDANIDPTLMDLQNIATHEIGHGVGLADMYDGACSEVTMYGYSDYGEIKKSDLEQSDITGLQELYEP